MKFCTKCGQELVEGQEHICPVDENKPQEQSNSDNKTFKIDGNGDSIGVSIDTQAVKEKYNNFVTHISETSSEFQNRDSGSFERGSKIVPDIIAANDGEIPIKQYNIAKLRSRITLSRAEGRLQVTNKRLIFRATGRSIMGKVTLHQEFKINELAGIEFRNRPEFNIFNIFLGLILTALCGGIGFFAVTPEGMRNGFITALIMMFDFAFVIGWIGLAVVFAKNNAQNRFYTLRLAALALVGGSLLQRALSSSYHYGDDGSIDYRVYFVFFAVVALLALINILLIAFVPNLVIKIKTNGAHSGIEIVKEEPIALLSFLFGKSHDENSGFLEILPWTDTDKAIKELGTIIDDINTLGDMAIEKWKEN